MPGSIATAYVQIIPTTEGITANLEKALGGEGDKAGRSAGLSFGKKFLKMAGTVVTVEAVSRFFKETINQGAELQQNIGGTQAVFGSAATDITSRASQAYKNMGLSASDYMATANKMGALFQGSGLSQVESMRLTTQAMQRAADVASVMGLDMSSAMESIAGAAKGNFTMMDNLGVAMNATTLQAYALEKGINFDWNTASQAEKSQLAMEMFFDRTSQYAGNFAREAETTISGSLGMVRASWSDFLGQLALGEDVTGAMRNLFTSVWTFTTGSLFPTMVNIFKGLGTLIGEGIATGWPMLTEWVGGKLEGLKSTVAEKWSSIKENISGKWNEIKSDVSGKAADVVNSVSNAWESAKSNTAAKWAAVQASVEAHGGGIRGVIGAAAAEGSSLWRAGMSAIDSATGGKLSEAAATASAKMSAIKSAFSSAMENASAKVKNGIEKIKSAFNFSWSLPSLKLPHFTVSGKFSLNPPSIPTFGVSWYKKAYEDPLIFTSPTVIPTMSGLKGFGDGNGAEVVMGLSRLRELVGGNDNAPVPAQTNQAEIIAALYEVRDAVKNLKLYLDGDRLVGGIADRIDEALGDRDNLTERGVA